MAKLTDDQIRFIIDLDAKGAQGQINTLEESIRSLEKENTNLQRTISANEKEMASLEKQMEKLRKKGQENTNAYRILQKQYEGSRQSAVQLKQELDQNNKKIAENRKQVKTLTDGLNTNEMSMRQLRQRARQLQQQLDVTSKSASPDTYKKLKNELTETQKAMGALSSKTKGISDILKTAGGTILGFIGTKLLSGFVSAIRSGILGIINFEQENANLASVLGKSQKEVQALTDDAKRLGAQTQYTASQITQLQTELAKLGFSETEILQSTEAVQAFATATGATLPDAAQVAGAALRAFGLDASEMERVVATMGVATSKSALNFTYLQNSLSTVAPVAKQFGFSIEDTTALLGTLANSGFEASTAATATRNILLNLADSSGKLAKRLGEPIKSMNDLIPALKQLKDGGIDLAETLELTDKRSVAAFATFLNSTDTLADLKSQITGVSDELHQMEAERLNTVKGSLTLLSSAWDGLMLSFSNSKGPIKTAIDWLTNLVNKVNELAGGGAERLSEQQLMLGEYYTEYARMSEMTLSQAQQFHRQQLKEDKNFITERERLMDALSDRDDEASIEKRNFYYNEIARRKVYLEEREKLLEQMTADEEEANRKAGEERKRQQAEADKEAAKAAEEEQKQRKERFQKELADLKENLEEQLLEEAKNYLERGYSKEEYEQHVAELTSKNLEEQLELARRYGIDVTKVEKQILSERIKQKEKAEKQMLKDAEDRLRAELKAARDTQRATLKAAELASNEDLAMLERRNKAGLLTDTQYQVQRQQIEEAYLQARLAAAVLYAEQVKNQDQSVVDAAQQAIDAAQSKLNAATQKRLSEARQYVSELRDVFSETANILGDTLSGQIMEQFAGAMDAVSTFQEQLEVGFSSGADAIAGYANMIGGVLTNMLNATSQIVKQIFEAETDALEAEKQKQLTIAGDNAAEREKIEQEYAQKELDLKKQQADADAALQTAQLWISTAQGIATAWATSMQLGPIAGPVVAAALTATLLAAAGVQQAAILKQRDAIKNTTLNSTSSSSSAGRSSTSTSVNATLKPEYNNTSKGYSDGGYTGNGAVLQPAGIVHKGEYVVSQAEMKNPTVIPMVRAIENERLKRKSGISSAGFADGGFANSGFAGTAVNYTDNTLLDIVTDLANQVEEMKKVPLRAYVNYHEFGSVEKIMDSLQQKATR